MPGKVACIHLRAPKIACTGRSITSLVVVIVDVICRVLKGTTINTTGVC